MEVGSFERLTLCESKMSDKTTLLERRLVDPEENSQGSGSAGSSRGHIQKKDVRCFTCGCSGHMARNCRGGCKRSYDPNADLDHKCARQAGQQGKAGRD